MWGKNARNVLSGEAWGVLRSMILEEHGWKCDLCGYSKTHN
jgi:hypothetical protein